MNGTLNSTNKFSFTVTQWDAVDGTQVTTDTKLPETTTVDTGDGTSATVSFDAITFTQADAGTTAEPSVYFYKIVENVPSGVTLVNGIDSATGIRYDTTAKWVKVSVADNGDGTLTITKTDGNNQTITGTYDAAFENEQLGSVQVTKTFSGVDALPENFQITATWGPESDKKTIVLKANDPGYTGTLPTDVNVEKSGNGPYTWTISNLPIGTEVTFTESGYEIAGYNVASTVTQVASGQSTASPAAGTSGAAHASAETTLPASAKVEITNAYTPGVELPATGGPGTAVYTVTGLTLTLGASLWLMLRRRKEQQN